MIPIRVVIFGRGDRCWEWDAQFPARPIVGDEIGVSLRDGEGDNAPYYEVVSAVVYAAEWLFSSEGDDEANEDDPTELVVYANIYDPEELTEPNTVGPTRRGVRAKGISPGSTCSD